MTKKELDKEFESSYDNYDEEIHKIIHEEKFDEEYDEDKVSKKRIILASIAIAVLTAGIVGGMSIYHDIKENNRYDEENKNKSTTEAEITEETEVVVEPTIEEEVTTAIEETTNTTATFDFSDEELDYSNVDTFYNQIVEYRSKYGEFAECFQTKEDVINFVNFINMFDETKKGIESSIDSQAMFDEIIADYYKSCVAHDIEPNLSCLIPEGYMRTVMEEGEKLSYNTKYFNGPKDYESANALYNYIIKNFLNPKEAIPQYNKYDPYIDWAREQYEQYRNTGNLINARKYQKNHTLEGAGIDLPDGYNGQDIIDNGGTYEIEPNGLYCPDAVDNLFSKSENIEETKWISSYDGTVPFEKVNEGFKDILGKRSR